MKQFLIYLTMTLFYQNPIDLIAQIEASSLKATYEGAHYGILSPGFLTLNYQRYASIIPFSNYLYIGSGAPSFYFLSTFPYPIGGGGNLAKWRYTTNGVAVEVMSLETSGVLTIKFLPNIGDYKNMQYNSATGEVGWDNSSRRDKMKIGTLEDNWLKILNTRPVKYTRPRSPDHWEYGYIAEEMDSIGLQNLVGYDVQGIPDDVHYDKMVVYLTEMIKIQQRSITSLQLQVDAQGKALRGYRDELTVSKSHFRKRKKSEISSAEDQEHKISSAESVVKRNN